MMKFARLLLNVLIISILLSAVRYEASVRKPQQSLPSRRQKFQKFEIYPRDLTYQLVGSQIVVRFQPKDSRGKNVSLDNLAIALEYEHFNWTNYVVKDPHGITNRAGQILSTPYNDPPKGGYMYDSADRLPFYWDVEQCMKCKSRHHWRNHHNLKQFELLFEDSPADYRLQPGETIEFVTNLVGVKEHDRHNQTARWEILHTFRWQLTNPRPNISRVSLLEADIAIEQLSSELRRVMQLDGAELTGDRQLQSSCKLL